MQTSSNRLCFLPSALLAADLTMKRVISGVLAMLVVLPALEISSGINGRDTPLALGGLHMLHSQAITGGSGSQAFNSSLLVSHARAGRERGRLHACLQLLVACSAHTRNAALCSGQVAVCIPQQCANNKHLSPCICLPALPLPQAFKESIQYELAGQKTGQLLLLVVANTTYLRNHIASQVDFNSSSSSSSSDAASRPQQQFRRYLEMQAVAYNSWVCPLNSSYVNSSSSLGPIEAADGIAPGWAVVSSAAEAAAAAAGAGAGVEAGQVLRGDGCEVLQSFVLMDIKWALQAQVRRLLAASWGSGDLGMQPYCGLLTAGVGAAGSHMLQTPGSCALYNKISVCSSAAVAISATR
jgi:hypothetical protein